MPRLIDENKAKEVLIDYYHIRTNIQQMSMEEAFSRVPTVDAIPVEWVEKYLEKWKNTETYDVAHCWWLIIKRDWEKENAGD